VFVEGGDRALDHLWYTSGWSGWERLGGVLSESPAAVSWGAGRVDVAVRGSDDAAWHAYFDGVWHGFDPLGGALASKPALSSQGAGQIELFVEGTDGALDERSFDDAWTPWQGLGGSLTSGPAAVSWGPGRTDAFVRGLDGGVWHIWTVISNLPASGWQVAVATATAQLGKPYQWAGAGPASFDCSGLTRWSWGAAGVMLPHLAQGQYDMARPIAIPDLLPGDLVFYGSPGNVYHVGIYVGNGTMIHAPHSGEVVQYESIYFSGLLAGGRVD
jgi:cell wall-associated NlpC family hydrolase